MSYLFEQALRGLGIARRSSASALRSARDWPVRGNSWLWNGAIEGLRYAREGVEVAIKWTFNGLIWLLDRSL